MLCWCGVVDVVFVIWCVVCCLLCVRFVVVFGLRVGLLWCWLVFNVFGVFRVVSLCCVV